MKTWVTIPAENHPLFEAALPDEPAISVKKMFGGLAAMVNGQMAAGLFARGFVVKLPAPEQARALCIDGAEPFDPMGDGRVMKNTVFLPEAVFCERPALRSWLALAVAHTKTLPVKQARKAPKKAAQKAAPTKAAKKAPPTKAAKKPGTPKRGPRAAPAKAAPTKIRRSV